MDHTLSFCHAREIVPEAHICFGVGLQGPAVVCVIRRGYQLHGCRAGQFTAMVFDGTKPVTHMMRATLDVCARTHSVKLATWLEGHVSNLSMDTIVLRVEVAEPYLPPPNGDRMVTL